MSSQAMQTLQDLNRKHRDQVWNNLTQATTEDKMSLIGEHSKKAEPTNKRLKLLLWGPEGSLKTRTALAFPKPFIIDMEGGTDHYANDFDFQVVHTTDPDVVMGLVTELLSTEHEYKTLILDPMTIYWSALQSKWADIFMEREKTSKGFKFDYYKLQGPDWNVLKKKDLYPLLHKLTMLKMNLIVTAHQKAQYADGEYMKKIGETFDGEKTLPYVFDTIVRTHVDDKGFWGECLKDRTNNMPNGKFELSYQVFADAFGSELNQSTTPVLLITLDQQEEIETLFVALTLDADTVKKALVKYNAPSVSDLTAADAAKIIKTLNAKLDKKE